MVENLDPYSEHSINLQIFIVESGEKSSLSDTVTVRTEESFPTEPLNLKVIGATTTLIKIAWDPPDKMNGVFKGYYVFNGENVVEQTNEQTCILNGLQAGTGYDVFVCASTNKGKGEKAMIRASTCHLGDILPEKPVFGLIGRREILIRWQPPQVITGKLNRYDLNMNGKCIYSGVALEYQVGMLKPDTEYKFEVALDFMNL